MECLSTLLKTATCTSSSITSGLHRSYIYVLVINFFLNLFIRLFVCFNCLLIRSFIFIARQHAMPTDHDIVYQYYSVRLSVRLAGTVSKRMDTSSQFFDSLIATSVCFSPTAVTDI